MVKKKVCSKAKVGALFGGTTSGSRCKVNRRRNKSMGYGIGCDGCGQKNEGIKEKIERGETENAKIGDGPQAKV